jgi:hypothetical protein
MSAWWCRTSSASFSSIRPCCFSRAISPGVCPGRSCWSWPRRPRSRSSRSSPTAASRPPIARATGSCSSASAGGSRGAALLPVPADAHPQGGGPAAEFLGILIDDSRSMSIADREGQPRSAFIQQQLNGPNAQLLAALSQKFVVRFFRFSSNSDRVGTAGDSSSAAPRRASPRARSRARRAGRASARRAGDGDRRRRHVRRRHRRDPRGLKGAIDPGLHGRCRAGTVCARRPGHPCGNTARRPERHGARRRRRAVAVGYGGKTVPLSVEDDGRIVSTRK